MRRSVVTDAASSTSAKSDVVENDVVRLLCSLRYEPTDCEAKYGTFAGIDMLNKQGVDVIFGPSCSVGKYRLSIPSFMRIGTALFEYYR